MSATDSADNNDDDHDDDLEEEEEEQEDEDFSDSEPLDNAQAGTHTSTAAPSAAFGKPERSQVIQWNNELAQHASRKDLTAAMALFHEAVDKQWANTHTYCAAINANVRCGSISDAADIFKQFRSKGFTLDIVSCTTMMKGYCSVGDIEGAYSLFVDIITKKPRVVPNIRTVNTLLRGCVNVGHIPYAESVMATLKDLSISPDISSWEYMTALLCQGLKLDKVQPLLGRINLDSSTCSGVAAMHTNLARASSLAGDWKVCRKSIKAAQAALEMDEKVPTQDQMASSVEPLSVAEDDLPPVATSEGLSEGGKRPWKTKANDASRIQSLDVFRNHRREELRYELGIIEAFLSFHQAANERGDKLFKFLHLMPAFLRAFSFAQVQSTSGASAGADAAVGIREHTAASLVSAQLQSFGLIELLRRLNQSGGETVSKADPAPISIIAALALAQTASKRQAKKRKHAATNASDPSACPTNADMASAKSIPAAPVILNVLTKPAETAVHRLFPAETSAGKIVQAMLTLMQTAVQESGVLDFDLIESRCQSLQNLVSASANTKANLSLDQVISAMTAKATQAHSKKELKLEICSGAGEWAIEQAKADPASHWMTLELRHDRVYQTLTRSIYAGLNNLSVLGGDAMSIIPAHIATESISHVFINHPEPPQQTGGRNFESQGKHLLTNDFFVEIARVLKDAGRLTIVTDSEWYSRHLLKTFSGTFFPSALSSVNLTGQELTKLNNKAKGQQRIPKPAGDQVKWSLADEIRGVHLYKGKPSEGSGHIVDASSYFDRLWKRENVNDRYFFVLEKTSVANDKRERVLKVGKLKGFIALAAPSSNKKIKFDE